MYVKDKMSTNLYTVGPNASVSEVLDLMSNNKLHRIPVIDANNKLLGIITEGVISANTPNKSSSLSIYEINYMLNKIKTVDIMIKDVITIDENALLEEAAFKMRSHNIGCLPVVENSKLVGIITHNDIFDEFIDLLGYFVKGTRYVINIREDRVGVFAEVAKIFAEKNISINNLAVHRTDRGIEVVIIANGDNSDQAYDFLKEKGYDVTSSIALNNTKN